MKPTNQSTPEWLTPDSSVAKTLQNRIMASQSSMAIAQDVSGLPSQRVYGVGSWESLIEAFKQATSEIPGSKLVKIPKSPYTLLCIDNHLVFPWRYSAKSGEKITEKAFVKSNARKNIFHVTKPDEQLELDLGIDLPQTKISTGKIDFDADPLSKYSVIIVGISSNSVAIHNIHWGVATPAENNYLLFNELYPLTNSNDYSSVVFDPDRSFNNGNINEIPIRRKVQAEENAQD